MPGRVSCKSTELKRCIIIVITPVLNSQGMKKKLRYAVQKSTKIKLEWTLLLFLLHKTVIIKDIYIAQVRKGHKCAMSAEMAAWLRNFLCLCSYLHN